MSVSSVPGGGEQLSLNLQPTNGRAARAKALEEHEGAPVAPPTETSSAPPVAPVEKREGVETSRLDAGTFKHRSDSGITQTDRGDDGFTIELPDGTQLLRDEKGKLAGYSPGDGALTVIEDKENKIVSYKDPQGNKVEVNYETLDWAITDKHDQTTQIVWADGTQVIDVAASTREQKDGKWVTTEGRRSLMIDQQGDVWNIDGDRLVPAEGVEFRDGKVSLPISQDTTVERPLLVPLGGIPAGEPKPSAQPGPQGSASGGEIDLELLDFGQPAATPRPQPPSEPARPDPSSTPGRAEPVGATPLQPQAQASVAPPQAAPPNPGAAQSQQAGPSGWSRTGDTIPALNGLTRSDLADGTKVISLPPNAGGIKLMYGPGGLAAIDGTGQELQRIHQESHRPPGRPEEMKFTVTGADGKRYTMFSESNDFAVESARGDVKQYIKPDGAIQTFMEENTPQGRFFHMHQVNPDLGKQGGTPGSRIHFEQPDRIRVEGSSIPVRELPYPIPTTGYARLATPGVEMKDSGMNPFENRPGQPQEAIPQGWFGNLMDRLSGRGNRPPQSMNMGGAWGGPQYTENFGPNSHPQQNDSFGFYPGMEPPSIMRPFPGPGGFHDPMGGGFHDPMDMVRASQRMSMGMVGLGLLQNLGFGMAGFMTGALLF